MAKQRVDLLLDPALVELADRRAAELRWSRTTLVTAALEDFLDSARRAVPDVPKARVGNLVETADGRVVKKDPEKPASFEVPRQGAEDGLPGPSFRLTVDQAHKWFGSSAEAGAVSGGYTAWRSRKERWMRSVR